MEKYNTTWIGTVSRTGTTWTNIIVKEILNHGNWVVFPKEALRTKQEIKAIYKKEALTDTNDCNHYVLACHAAIATNLPRCKYITNIRNPYDICASIYRFMNISKYSLKLESAIYEAQQLPQLIDHYSQVEKDKLLIINFEHIDEKTITLIKNISKFLGVCVTEEFVHSLAEKYSRENLRKMISENDRSLREKLSKKKIISDHEIIIRENEDIRSFDQKTGYQTGHVSEKKNEGWRSIFSQPQVEKIIDSLDDIATALGYRSEKVH